MANASKKFEAIKKELLRDTDLTCELIAHLTGKDLRLVEHMPPDELLSYLSYLLQERKESDKNLHWRHDKSAEEPKITDRHSYQLEAHGLVSSGNKLRSKKFGAKPAVYEMLRILSGLAATAQMQRPGKASTAIGSNTSEVERPVVNVREIMSNPHVVDVMITHTPAQSTAFKKI